MEEKSQQPSAEDQKEPQKNETLDQGTAPPEQDVNAATSKDKEPDESADAVDQKDDSLVKKLKIRMMILKAIHPKKLML